MGPPKYRSVVQLVRTSRLHRECQPFESVIAYHLWADSLMARTMHLQCIDVSSILTVSTNLWVCSSRGRTPAQQAGMMRFQAPPVSTNLYGMVAE